LWHTPPAFPRPCDEYSAADLKAQGLDHKHITKQMQQQMLVAGAKCNALHSKRLASSQFFCHGH
jgi:hypothetical protein